MNVLISSAGRRVSLVRSFQRAVQDLLPGHQVIASDLRPNLSAACQVADDAFQVPRLDTDDFIEVLLAECRTRGIRLVIPTIDTELAILAQHRDAFEADGIHIVVSDAELIRLTSDKELSPKLFAELGLETPEVLDRSDLRFPLVAKPKAGSGSAGIIFAAGLEDLPPRYLHDPSIMFQTMVPKDGFDEITVDLYYSRAGELQCLVPRLRIETRGGEVSKGVTLRDGIENILEPALAVLPGARGCVTLQCFSDTGRQRVLAIEINPRFGGGYPLSDAAGARFPEALIEEYLLGIEPSRNDEWRDGLLMLRYDDAAWSTWSR